MDMQVVPKIGISSVVHSKHIDPGSIDVVGNDIALFDTESVISLYNGPSKLEVVSIGLCLEGSTRFNISLREFELIPGRMVIALPNQIIEHRQFSSNFRGIFFAVSKSLLESLPKVGNVLSFFFFLKDYPCFDLNLHEQEMIKEYHAFIRKRLKNKDDRYRREVVMGLMQGFFFELCNIFNSYAPDASAVVKNKSRKEYIFERFYESLVQSYQSERSVKFYADQLCLTPKHLSTKSDCWNEPLLCSYHSFAKLESRSLVDLKNTGYQVSAANIKDGKIILRLFNAEGDRKQHNITFDMPLSSIEEVDLNGRVIDRKTIKTRTGKSEISISMPRFGLKTFALNLN